MWFASMVSELHISNINIALSCQFLELAIMVSDVADVKTDQDSMRK